MATVTEDKWVVRLRVADIEGTIAEKFWAGPNVGSGLTGTSAKRAKTFDTREAARASASSIKKAAHPKIKVVSVRPVKRSELLDSASVNPGSDKSAKSRRQDEFALDIMTVLRKFNSGGRDAQLAVVLAEELLAVGYRKK